jgi:Family of unknown function (DUF6130)
LVGITSKSRRLQWLLAGLVSLSYWFQGGLALAAGLSEVAPPAVIAQLATAASGSPQVSIASPRPDEVVNTNNVLVNMQVQGVPIFKNAALGLGPHLHLLLDHNPAPSVYDLTQPVMLSNLTPGTHTLQVLLAKPWHESWKNSGAFAQVTFHVFTKSAEPPLATSPTLVYNEPSGNYGAEPFLLDFYVANAPSHLNAKQQPLNDWRVRATINDQSFEVDKLQPFYLKGLKPGANLVKLEYLNAQGQLIDSALRVVNYQPHGEDGLARLLRNELSLTAALALFDPASQHTVVATAPLPAAVPVPLPSPVVVPLPTPVVTIPSPAPVALPTSAPIVPVNPLPAPVVVLPSVPAVVTPPVNLRSSSPPIPISPVPEFAKSVAELPVATMPVPEKQPLVAVPVPSLTLPELPAVAPVAPIVPKLPPIAVTPTSPVSWPAPTPIAQPRLVEPVIPSTPPIALPVAPPAVARTIAPVAGEDAIEFQVLAQEFWHTLSVRIKKFTNSIPPTMAQWSKGVGHWIGDRSQAMKSSPKTVAPTNEPA